jgi:mevalonate kinase
MELEIHAKLTGAGGGGCVICFPKEPDFDGRELFKEFESKGFTVYA